MFPRLYFFFAVFHFCYSSVLKSSDLPVFYNEFDPDSLTDFEVIYLPMLVPLEQSVNFDNSEEVLPIHYNLSAFGRNWISPAQVLYLYIENYNRTPLTGTPFMTFIFVHITVMGVITSSLSLKLKPNNNLLAPSFKVLIHDEESQRISDGGINKNCHYLHKDEFSVAAFSLCQPKSIHAMIFLGNSTLEINPLNSHLKTHKKVREILEKRGDNEYLIPHIIKRSPFNFVPTEGDALIINEDIIYEDETVDNNEIFETKSFFNFITKRQSSKLTIEVALFFDEAGYKIFAPYLKYDDNRLTNMLLAYMNGIQALYHHPSLGRSAELALVRLEIMKKQPSNMRHYDGERSKLLDSFCDYQQNKNPGTDEHPEHWDMALYVSGLDFFAYENGRKSGVTMGLAPVGGVCLKRYNCVIAELGTTNVFGKPYPSAGFTSVYILAHEIGHNLGMHHDSTGNSCPKEGYIMSPSRGTNGETIWSTCSADVMSKLNHATCLTDKPGKLPSNLNHNKFSDTPGQSFGAKRQCEILLRDKDAVMSPNQKISDICYNLQCKTPHRSGFYYAGPALEGTDCGRGKWCQGGNCIKMMKQKPASVIPGGWSPWKPEKCSSGCLEKSKGFQNRQRECNNPKPVNTEEGCEGTGYDTVLCTDTQFCGKRKSPTTYASTKCKEFSKLLPELDSSGAGLQAPHEEGRPWMGCAIFCRRADTKGYYTPRVELNDLNVSPYFPDGTWCHQDRGIKYYCLHHHCLPENFQFTKTSYLYGIGEDIPIAQNANPKIIVPPELHSYLSLSPEGKPLQTSLKPNEIKPPREDEWETDDFIQIPKDINIDEDNNNVSIY